MASIDLTSLGEYEIIMADPPWTYGSPAAVPDTMKIEPHYQTMSLDDIKNMLVPGARNSLLFIWATSPLLPQAFEVMKSWGYKYKTSAVWRKSYGYKNGRVIGNSLGFYFMIKHEFLLLGEKGTFKKPDPGSRSWSVFDGVTRGHSIKPDVVYDIIDRMYPGASKIELFARRRRDGWDAWGNQVDNKKQMTLKNIALEV